MGTKTIKGGAGYKSPVCAPVEISLEGMLCESFGTEKFDGAENYGDSSEGAVNKGWY